MQTATRGPGESAVYEAPLYDDMPATVHPPQQRLPTQASCRALLSEIKQLPQRSVYSTEPNWQNQPQPRVIFDANVAIPSNNISQLTRAIMRKHNAWGHPSPRVLREMLRAKGTQHSKRLAKKVMDLFQSCNFCLSGCSHKQPHVRDPDQPTTKAIRPL